MELKSWIMSPTQVNWDMLDDDDEYVVEYFPPVA